MTIDSGRMFRLPVLGLLLAWGLAIPDAAALGQDTAMDQGTAPSQRSGATSAPVDRAEPDRFVLY